MFFLIVDVANAFAAALIGITVLIAAPRRGSAQSRISFWVVTTMGGGSRRPTG